MVLALAHLHGGQAFGFVHAQDGEGGGQGREIAQRHARGKGRRIRLVQPSVHAGHIALPHVPAGSQQGMRQRAVVGEEQQPRGVLVQAAHGQHPAPEKRRRYQVHHRLRASVAGGGEHARGLVKHVVLQGFVIHGRPREGDLVPLPHLGGRVTDGGAVNLRKPVPHGAHGLTARSLAALGQVFIQPDAAHARGPFSPGVKAGAASPAGAEGACFTAAPLWALE